METEILEISLIVEEELVEPVAELLAGYVKGGVAIESTAVASNLDGSPGRSIGPLKVYGYLIIDEFDRRKTPAVAGSALVSWSHKTAP